MGLAILTSIGLINICEVGMHETADLENELTSVERIIEYTRVPSEPPLESDDKNAPPDNWPQLGRIEFKSLNFWYDENGARILRNLTFQIAVKVRKKIFCHLYLVIFIVPLLNFRKKWVLLGVPELAKAQ